MLSYVVIDATYSFIPLLSPFTQRNSHSIWQACKLCPVGTLSSFGVTIHDFRWKKKPLLQL